MPQAAATPKVNFKRTAGSGNLDAFIEGQTNPFEIEKNLLVRAGYWDAYSVRMGGKRHYFSSQRRAKDGVVAYVQAKAEAKAAQ